MNSYYDSFFYWWVLNRTLNLIILAHSKRKEKEREGERDSERERERERKKDNGRLFLKIRTRL